VKDAPIEVLVLSEAVSIRCLILKCQQKSICDRWYCVVVVVDGNDVELECMIELLVDIVNSSLVRTRPHPPYPTRLAQRVQ